jgi:hypothetical protein
MCRLLIENFVGEGVLQLLGRNINLAGLITQRLNKMFRENLEFLFERFECHDLCAIVVGAPPPNPPNPYFFLLIPIPYQNHKLKR